MTERVIKWACRRYLRFVALGIVSTFAVLNLALQAGAGLLLYCSEECLALTVRHSLSPFDRDILNHVRSHWLDPPAAKGSYKANGLDLINPPWSTFSKWGDANKFLIDYFKKYPVRGTFVDVGAQDGEFMSFTLYLEQVLNFTGLLIEPNPEHYSLLRQMGRSSHSINACATPGTDMRKEELWLRDTPKDLPPVLRRIQEGSNRLLQYVSSEDRELGRTQTVQCFYLPTMVQAALRTRGIDLLAISTHGGELDILDGLTSAFQFRVLVLVTPLATQDETSFLQKIALARKLTRAYSSNNIHIYLPSNEVKVVSAR